MVEAIAALAVERDARRKCVTDRQIDRTLQAKVGVVADLSLPVTTHLAAGDRIVRIHQYGAARGILDAEGALRATKDFDAGNIVVRFSLEISGERCDAVAIRDYANCGLRVVFGFSNAANVEVITLAEVVDHRARGCELQRIDHGYAKVRKIRATDDRCGDRRRLK